MSPFPGGRAWQPCILRLRRCFFKVPTREGKMSRTRCCAGAALITRFTIWAALSALAGTADAADKLVFVTDYGLYGRHAYYFVAMEKGYYARENLEIEIVRSQGWANTIKQVANATAQVG